MHRRKNLQGYKALIYKVIQYPLKIKFDELKMQTIKSKQTQQRAMTSKPTKKQCKMWDNKTISSYHNRGQKKGGTRN